MIELQPTKLLYLSVQLQILPTFPVISFWKLSKNYLSKSMGYSITELRVWINQPINNKKYFFLLVDCSPILWVSEYQKFKENSSSVDLNQEDSTITMCLMSAISDAQIAFFLVLIILFFILPLLMLLGLYSVIVRHLVRDSATTSTCSDSYHARARRQVVLMLLTVVFSFFVCLAPFRLLTLYIIMATEGWKSLGPETYYNLLYFSRIMFYLNSAINPILYNLMSSRFRIGFLKLCGLRTARSLERSTFRSNITASKMSRRATRMEAQQENFVWDHSAIDKQLAFYHRFIWIVGTSTLILESFRGWILFCLYC